ncbi:MAG: hypothetical protein AAF676_15135, partial [Pseudomonadota bacterium]
FKPPAQVRSEGHAQNAVIASARIAADIGPDGRLTLRDRGAERAPRVDPARMHALLAAQEARAALALDEAEDANLSRRMMGRLRGYLSAVSSSSPLFEVMNVYGAPISEEMVSAEFKREIAREPGLRRALQDLVEAHEELRGFMQAPPAEIAEWDAASPPLRADVTAEQVLDAAQEAAEAFDSESGKTAADDEWRRMITAVQTEGRDARQKGDVRKTRSAARRLVETLSVLGSVASMAAFAGVPALPALWTMLEGLALQVLRFFIL